MLVGDAGQMGCPKGGRTSSIIPRENSEHNQHFPAKKKSRVDYAAQLRTLLTSGCTLCPLKLLIVLHDVYRLLLK